MNLVQLEIFIVSYVYLQNEVLARFHYHTYRVPDTTATVYNPRVIAKTCLLKPDIGPCRSEISMYYYDPKEKNCTTFKWGGCQGNGNRYNTMEECFDNCWSKPNEQRERPKFCKLSFDYGYCFGDLKRWYYDHVWKTCKETIYSGCGGNKNNFYGLEQCEAVCRFGNSRHKLTTNKYSLHRVLIVNPKNDSTRRGKDQVISTAVTTNIMKN